MVRVGIVGATGYTALELLKLLLRHPEVQITRMTSRESAGSRLDSVHASLRETLKLEFTAFDIEDFQASVDFAFSCLPHAASARVVRQLVEAGIKVVDFSADYRLNDVRSFETWYGVTHPDPDQVGKIPYGIPELFGNDIKNARLVANPGCFPTSVVIPIGPLLQRDLIEPDRIIVDSKTGISGAGRKAELRFHFPECNESVAAYSVGQHRHSPEMDQILGRVSGKSTQIVFTPHLIPMDRGILSTIYVSAKPGVDASQLMNALESFYSKARFVRITADQPATKDVAGTNYCDITIRRSGELMVVVSAIDNLIKGASGAAVQNFNVMQGFAETTALL
jgi:N-acetyl-gamma-glutamyl-phosphate reductase